MTKNKKIDTLREEWYSSLPGFYNDSSSSVSYNFAIAFLREILVVSRNIAEYDNDENLISGLKAAIFISTANGIYLDDYGKLFNLIRFPGESDTDFRARILSAYTSSISDGTLSSIKQALATIVGVTEDDVIITENISVVNDTFTYNTGTLNYSLSHLTIIGDSLILSGTVSASPYTFIKGTDYTIDDLDGEINFIASGTLPDNGTTVDADYDYQNNLKVAVSVPLPFEIATSDLITTVKETLQRIKAAGVYFKLFFSSALEDEIKELGETISLNGVDLIFAGSHSAGDNNTT